jgi:hypothetical protein
MNEPFGETKQQPDPEIAKKKQLWRNLFLLNLCVSLLLVGIFWLPCKGGAGTCETDQFIGNSGDYG